MAKVEAKKETINIAVYKANLHCPKCAHDIKKPLMRTPGVHKVDVMHEKGEIRVEGTFEVKKIHERLEKWSRKKVEVLSQDKKPIEKKETKKETIKTTKIKAYMQCDKCEHDLRAKLLKHKGIHNVKTDIKSQTILVEGTIEAEKIVTYMQKRARKHEEVISEPPPKEVEKKVEEKVIVDVVTTKIVEFEEKKKVEAKGKDGEVPYFVHYVYAPQLFSDENPNACLVM
ncbi:hypothetical protein L1987_76812 [Smallanthus sonchifolius]|uniref:Uncharacterized protein n=1 Tax=Smallanthus sonchifolius TaxID=185202 RepID=A0ACB8Z7T6_9ASTR|nr:hypothetical protein L1987_76812 [Smallanthus sonchifolius]